MTGCVSNPRTDPTTVILLVLNYPLSTYLCTYRLVYLSPSSEKLLSAVVITQRPTIGQKHSKGLWSAQHYHISSSQGSLCIRSWRIINTVWGGFKYLCKLGHVVMMALNLGCMRLMVVTAFHLWAL